MNSETSYRKRYHESATYHRARRRERRERFARRALLIAYFLFITLAIAHAGAAIFRSL